MQFPLMPTQMLNLLLAQCQCSNLGPSPYPPTTSTTTTPERIKPLAVAGGRLLPYNLHKQQQQQQSQPVSISTTASTSTPPSSPSSTALSPLLNRDFPDPSILYDVDIESGIGTYYAFATASNGRNIQAAAAAASSSSSSSSSGKGAWTYLDTEILPSPGNWTLLSSSSNGGSSSGSGGGNTWAPDVRQLRPNHYVMYYSGELSGNNSAYHCIGAATATSPLGPYTALDTPLACPIERGGAIDPSGFVDEDTGKRYLLYKIDGNSLGNGGECNNGVAPFKSTPIILQEVDPVDGVTLLGEGVEILDRVQGEDGPLVEAPSLVRVLVSSSSLPSSSSSDSSSAATERENSGEEERKAVYVLFYSSHCWMTDLYRVNYATAENISGPYTRAGDGKPLIWTGDGRFNLTAPGGATGWSTDTGRGRLVFHANCAEGRCLFEAGFQVLLGSGNGNVSVVAVSVAATD